MTERCFACGRLLRELANMVITEDNAQTVSVGRDCYAKVRALDRCGGYQPPKGGPRLFLIGSVG